MSESDSRRPLRFSFARLELTPDTAIPMAESRFEEPLLCLDIESADRIKGCGSTCDVTEARDGIQTSGRLAAVVRGGARRRWRWSTREDPGTLDSRSLQVSRRVVRESQESPARAAAVLCMYIPPAASTASRGAVDAVNSLPGSAVHLTPVHLPCIWHA